MYIKNIIKEKNIRNTSRVRQNNDPPPSGENEVVVVVFFFKKKKKKGKKMRVGVSVWVE